MCLWCEVMILVSCFRGCVIQLRARLKLRCVSKHPLSWGPRTRLMTSMLHAAFVLYHPCARKDTKRDALYSDRTCRRSERLQELLNRACGLLPGTIQNFEAYQQMQLSTAFGNEPGGQLLETVGTVRLCCLQCLHGRLGDAV